MNRSRARSPKGLTRENHLQRDSRLDFWAANRTTGAAMETQEWVGLFLSFSIPINAPDELREIFERAQAVIVYGCYHYPLFTIGCEELLRYHESLLRVALGANGFDKKGHPLNFIGMIDRAVKTGMISAKERESWDAGRVLRNTSSHKVTSNLLGPNEALNALEIAQARTERLFSLSSDVSE